MFKAFVNQFTRVKRFLALIFAMASISCQPFGLHSKTDLESTISASSIVMSDRGPSVGALTPYGCDKGFPKQWTFEFYSEFAEHKVQIEYADNPVQDMSLVRIDRMHFKTQLPLPFPQADSDELCRKLENKQAIIQWQPGWQESFELFTKKLLPVCQINMDEDGSLFCELSHRGAEKSFETISYIQRRLIQKWNRHPYLLARRIAITKKMAAMMRSGKDEDLLRFCRLLSESLPEELPLVMRSQKWFDHHCQSGTNQQSAQLISLSSAIQEIEYLTETLRSQSRLGYLSVKIDRKTTDFRDFWVILKPIVGDQELNPSDSVEPQTNEKPRVCWHPLIMESPENAVTASRMQIGFSASMQTLDCPVLLSEESFDLKRNAEHYIKDSIASETEFAISNGRSKLLRLPMGRYQYTIEPQKHSFSEFYPTIPSASISQGSVLWADKRPRVTIDKL